MSPKKATKKTKPAPASKSTKKATDEALASIQANIDAIDGKKPTTKGTGRGNPTKKEPKAKKISALDAAAKVLSDSNEPLNTRQMIEKMAEKGLWKSPGGKTPHATLYSAILREITTKGKEARFTKTERGKFQANG
jgi:hypothetical protein